MNLLSVQNITKSFGINCVLRDVSLTLPAGARLLVAALADDGRAYFHTEAGEDGYIERTQRDGRWEIAGRPEGDSFVSLPYAG